MLKQQPNAYGGSMLLSESSSSAPSVASSSPRACIGTLRVVVIKSSGAIFESGGKHRIRLSVGQQTHATHLKKHPLGSSKKPIVWEETFQFNIGLPTDFLALTCCKGSKSFSTKLNGSNMIDPKETQVGALTIALAHLPQSSEVTKWYELKNGGQSVAVLQLRLLYHLTYSIHRRDVTSSLTIVPSQPAREFLRKELFKYAKNSKIKYRFIDYFLVVGSENPTDRATKPRVLERYPLNDRPDFSIPAQLESFCYPAGYQVSHEPKKPICFSFRLNNQTDAHSDQTIAAVLCWWERITVPRSTIDDSESSNSPDENRDISTSSLDDEAATDLSRSRNSISRQGSTQYRTSLEFQGASPLTPSYRVMPSSQQATTAASFSPASVDHSQIKVSPVSSPEPLLSTPHSPQLSNQTADDDLVHLYVPRSLVILSRLSFVPIFKDILVTLYQHYHSPVMVMSHSPSSDCPICVDVTSHDAHSCGMAVDALAHHNAAIASAELARAQESLDAPASSIHSSPSSVGQHHPRMDISGMGSTPRPNLANGHQPDISSFGSSALPSTPNPPLPPRLSSKPPVHPNTPATKAKVETKVTAPVPQPTTLPPFIPYPAFQTLCPTTPSNSSGAASSSTNLSDTSRPFCNPECCPCSCCTIRIDCRGLTFEQYMTYLVDEVPLPLPGSTSVAIQVCCKSYQLHLPASELDFPQLDFPLSIRTPSSSTSTALTQTRLGLFQILDVEVVLLILRCILSEMKLVFHSSSLSLLHSVTESLIQLCFPFNWSHIYIPLLPSALYSVLEAPVSFIIGIESRGLAEVEAMLGMKANRVASQQNQNDEIGRRHSAAVDELISEHPTNEPNEEQRPMHDLSNFAFIDIDCGTVDVNVPPPPFPPTAQQSLIRNIRQLTKPQLFHHDQFETEPQGQVQDETTESNNSLQHGPNFHLHYHPLDLSSCGPSVDNSPASNTRAIGVTSPETTLTSNSASPINLISPSPPTSVQLAQQGDEDSATPAQSASPTLSFSTPFITTQLPPPTTPMVSLASQQLLDSARSHDRSIRIEFLQFLASLIANYRDYLFFVSGATPVFDTPSFLSLKGRSESLPFLSRFLESQVFRDFLDRHVEFPSYLQDYLLYINSHSDPVDIQRLTRGKSIEFEPPPTPRQTLFYATPPEPLKNGQVSAVIYSQTHQYLRLLNEYHRSIPNHDMDATVLATTPIPFRHPALFTTKSWCHARPLFGLLSPGALAPDLPLKLRSRANSLIITVPAAQRSSSQENDSPHISRTNSPQPSPSSGGLLSVPSVNSISSPMSPLKVGPSGAAIRSTIFPTTRIFSLRHTDEDVTITLGKNPSTLNHTLLFSKMYDGINSALSEHTTPSSSHLGTPNLTPGELSKETRELLLRKGGLAPVAIEAFTSNSPTANTTSIFQSAFASYGPPSSKDVTAGSSHSSTPLPSPASKQSTLNSLSPVAESSHRSPPPAGLSVSVPTANGSARDIVPLPELNRSHSHLNVNPETPDAAPSLSSTHSLPATSSTRPPPLSRRRQMSLNLLSKAEFENKKLLKHPSTTRLGQVVLALMTPKPNTNTTTSHVDLGELSAVGELLALPEWRANLVAFFGNELGLAHENAQHKQLPTSSFLSLSLLFNIALEECSTDSDFVNALSLLHFSGKIFNFPGVELVYEATSPSHRSQSSVEREYLRMVLKRQQLWRNVDFWSMAYRQEITHRLEHPPVATPTSLTRSLSSSSTSSPSPASVPASPIDRESVIFELVAGLIYLQLSLGVDEELVREVVASTCQEFGLSDDKRQTLKVLVANIKRTTQATMTNSQPDPMPVTTPTANHHTTYQRNSTTPMMPSSHQMMTPSLTLQYPAADQD